MFSGLNLTGTVSKSSIDSTIPLLPEKVTLKLEPNSYETFVYVNKAAFANPKVCITMSIQRRLSSVITFLEKKWKPNNLEVVVKPIEDINESKSSPDLSTSFAQQNRLEKFNNKDSELWIQVRQSRKAVLPSLLTVEPITSASLSLSQLQCNNAVKVTAKNNNEPISRTTNDIRATLENSSSDENMTLVEASTTLNKNSNADSAATDAKSPESFKFINENTIGASDKNKSFKAEADLETNSNSLEEGLKRGWNTTLGSSITVGEVLLMLGATHSSTNQSKQILELTYGWRPKLETSSNDVKPEPISQDTSQSCNGNVKTPSVVEQHGSVSKPTSVLAYLGMFTGAEVNRKQKLGKVFTRTSPINNSMKGVILTDGQRCGKDLLSSLHSDKQGLDNGSLLMTNDTSSSNAKQNGGLVVPIVNENVSKEANNVNNPNSNGDSFRRPIDPPLRNLNAQQQHQRDMFRQQLDLLVPKYTQRKGRPLMRSKNIVSRQLPLQPKIVPQPLIKTLNGNVKIRLKSNQQHPVQLLQQNNTVISFKETPIAINVSPQPIMNSSSLSHISEQLNGNIKKESKDETNNTVKDSLVSNEDINNGDKSNKSLEEGHTSPDKKIEPSEDESPSLSFHNEDSLGSLSFLNDSTASNSGILHFRPSSAASDNAMYGGSHASKMNGDNFLDSVLDVSNGPCSSVLQTPPIHRSTSPPSSPPSSHLNPSHSQSWLPELSLTSFLNNFGSSSRGDFGISGSGHELSRSSLKIRYPSGEFPSHLMNEDSQQSTGSEVDRQLLSMMNENSVDFTSKFAKLASAVTSDTSADS